ncbi:MAG: 50S ribosomal protein L11 methyltransferase [Fibrobacter sp.]|jgi:ribosomal protein L11 methyltransferase|nr:50S ribosomal protein L11 methyltransferase [Fibrobacter sp.]
MKKTDTWYKAKGSCPAEEYEMASYFLFDAGVQTLEELETNEGKIFFCFYTASAEDRARIVAQFPQYHFELFEEPARDWDLWWRERAQPVAVSPHLYVRPPWVAFENPEAIILELEAKTAFGTGEHATTSLTATLMESIPLQGKTLLDVGTGTGILAMFARRRGAHLAVGTEIDPLAIPCIAENFERNGFTESGCVLGFLDAFKESVKFDIIVCNMIRSELWVIREEIMQHLAPDGFLILSGQLAQEKHYILDWFREENMEIAEEQTRDEWWAVSAQKKGV